MSIIAIFQKTLIFVKIRIFKNWLFYLIRENINLYISQVSNILFEAKYKTNRNKYIILTIKILTLY